MSEIGEATVRLSMRGFNSMDRQLSHLQDKANELIKQLEHAEDVITRLEKLEYLVVDVPLREDISRVKELLAKGGGTGYAPEQKVERRTDKDHD